MAEIKLINVFELLKDDIEKAYREHNAFEVPEFQEIFFEEKRPMKKIFKLTGEMIGICFGLVKRILEVYWQKILIWIMFAICIVAVEAGSTKAAAILFALSFAGVEWRCAWHRRRKNEIDRLGSELRRAHNRIQALEAKYRDLDIDQFLSEIKPPGMSERIARGKRE